MWNGSVHHCFITRALVKVRIAECRQEFSLACILILLQVAVLKYLMHKYFQEIYIN